MPKLTDLIGKVCTISTVEVNFRFKAEQMMDYFMGLVEDIDDEFIWLRHPQTKCLSVIARKYIVNIAEEQVLFEDNPDHAKIIAEYRQEKPITAAKTAITPGGVLAGPPALTASPHRFVDPKGMADLARRMKEAHKRDNK